MLAINVTETPEQIVAAAGLLVMLIVGVAVEPTDIVIALLVAIDGAAQVKDEVIRHVTVWPFVKVVVVYVLLFVPTFKPFTCHW